jgi:hypothetical protein
MKAFSLPLTCFLLLSLSITGFSQWTVRGDGSEFQESRTVPAFTKLSLSLHAEVVIVKGNSPGVRIEGEKNIIEKLNTEVGDNELKIYFPLLKEIRPTKPLRIWVTTPNEIRGIWNSGSGSIRSDEVFASSDFSLHLSGSGKITAGVKADAVSVSMSGSGGVQLTGTTKQLSCGISGSGRIHADDLSVTDRSKVHISGSGSVNFTTDGIIEGRISGSGCINYKGNPSSVDVHHSGSGRARKVA